ncbi:RagB/SusD family nutrient uptake outer membrane protein [Paraflavisolibacter sp. H34]|uniref:RagB/SusD family nutrient uptake outer membrane protein n=1 Tax=Huijunlia imazamoxiresistens TaxID=3127457 RepID=UPI0030173293
MKNQLMNRVPRKALLLLLAVVALAATSCRKFLDPKPKDVILDKDYLNDYWDAQFLLRGAYQALQPMVDYMFVLGEMRGDWVKPGTGADKDLLELAEHKVTPTNRYTNWSVFYDLINRANYVIKNVPRIPLDANNFSEFNRKQYIGEAKFLRSLAYFYLVRNFDAVPLVLEPTDSIQKVAYLPAIAGDSILNFIEKDLKDAYETTDIQIWVPNSFDAGLRVSGEMTRARATKGTVCALQAEVYLWRNKYAEAAAACQAWQNTGQYPFILNGTTAWFSIFTLDNQLFNEQMFQVIFTFASRETSSLMKLTSNDPASGGQYMVAPSEVAVKSYNPNWPNSIGTSNTTDELYRGFGNSYAGSAPFYNRVNSNPVIWKFNGLATVKPANVDVPANVRAPYQSDYRWHVYRQADVYLLWAEALNRLNDKASAIARINSVRSRAGMTMPASITATSSTEAIEDFILKERALELGFEGRRWFDLVRMARRGRVPVLIDAVKKRAPAALHPHLEETLAQSKNWYLPYNAEELRLNPQLKPKP